MNNTKQNHRTTRAGKLKTMILLLLLVTGRQAMAQDNATVQNKWQYGNYGNNFNIGVGIGYYGYMDQYAPFLFANYEFKIARNFTLAPFIGFSSYRSYDNYYYGGEQYYYQETVIPVGAKVAYYFDELFGANPKWDFYAAASLGFVYDHVAWEDGYSGNTGDAHTASPLYLDAHIGSKYHFNRRVAVFLDLSTGVSTLGLTFHTR